MKQAIIKVFTCYLCATALVLGLFTGLNLAGRVKRNMDGTDAFNRARSLCPADVLERAEELDKQ